MRVLIGGMIRSGSTLTFNAAREILSDSGRVSTSTEDSFGKWIDESSFDHFITKSHVPNAQVTDEIRMGSVKGICTIRRPEDAIVSFHRTFGADLDQSIQHVWSWLDWYSSIFTHLLTIEFGLIETAPVSAIAQIDEFLTGTVAKDRAARIAASYEKSKLKNKLDALEENPNTINIGFSYYDKDSFFHRRHISSISSQPAVEFVSERELTHIRNSLNRFVDSSGHLRPVSSILEGDPDRKPKAWVPLVSPTLPREPE